MATSYASPSLGRENVVLSTERAANDLLRERGTIYSSREHLVMASDILSDNLRPLLLGYDGEALLTPLLLGVAARGAHESRV